MSLVAATEQSQERIAFSNSLISTTTELINVTRQAGVILVVVIFFNEDTSLEECKRECVKKTEQLAELARNKYCTDEDRIEITFAIKTCRYAVEELDEALRLFKRGTTIIDFYIVIEREIKEFVPITDAMSSRTTDFMTKQIRLRDERSARRLQTKLWTYNILCFSFASNVLIALALIYSFSSYVARRLALIEENFERFNKSLPLHVPAPGSDEIARLDHQFHTVATALNEAWQKDKAMFANLPIGLLACAVDGTVELCNPKSERIFQFGADDLVGKSILSLERSGHLSTTWQQRSFCESEKCVFQRADEIEFPAEVSLASFEHESETKVLVSVEDISERQALAQFRQQLVSMVSHDIRTPLTSLSILMAHLEVLIATDQHEEAVSKIGKLSSEFARLYRLTSDLLDMARTQATRIETNLQVVQLSAIMDTVIDAVIWFANEKDIAIVVAPAPNEKIRTDPDRLTQILINLVNNALKFSSTGSTVEVSIHSSQRAITFSVQDHGRGMNEGQLQMIFEPFTQVKTEDKESGSGLGLAICKMLAESLGASLEVSSVLGRGSTFSVVLPTEPSKDV